MTEQILRDDVHTLFSKYTHIKQIASTSMTFGSTSRSNFTIIYDEEIVRK